MKRLADILAHHNIVPITLGFLFLAGGTALAASPAVRDAVVGSAVMETVSVDNSAITDVNLDHFDANMTIADVTEDAQNYYVAYRYQSFNVEGAAWKETPKDGVLTVAKGALLGGDLKAYAIEQLRQVVESDLAYLKRAQAAEIAGGRSESRVSTSYHGLAGFAIEMKDVLLPPAPAVFNPPVEVAPVLPKPDFVIVSARETSLIPIATTTVLTPATLPEVATTTDIATTTTSVSAPILSEATTTATTTNPLSNTP